MSDGPQRTDPTRYAREIERRWSALLDKPVVLSPRDWALISAWHARGVPLPLVLESMEAVASVRPGRRPPRNLAHIAAAVEESWAALVEGRRAGPSRTRPRATTSSAAAGRREGREHEPSSTAVRRLLAELAEALDRGNPTERLQSALEHALRGIVPAERLLALEREIERELAPFADRMDPLTRDRTRHAAFLARLTRELDLPDGC
jgi:hypothetical protein